MSSGFYDLESWRRVWGPAIRAFGYAVGIFVVFFIVVWLPMYMLIRLGLTFLEPIGALLFPVVFLFGCFLAIFKVLEDQKPPGVVQLL